MNWILNITSSTPVDRDPCFPGNNRKKSTPVSWHANYVRILIRA